MQTKKLREESNSSINQKDYSKKLMKNQQIKETQSIPTDTALL